MPKARTFNITRLDAESVPLMEQLLTVFGDAFGETDTYCGNRPDTGYLAQLLDSDNFVALAAVTDEGVAGGLAAYVLPKFEQQRSEMYLYDLAVGEHHRRQGIATALIEELRNVAAKRGVYVIFVQADRADGPAVELYSRLGVREDVLHFDISVD